MSTTVQSFEFLPAKGGSASGGKKTPLFSRHEALGAKIVDFHGWALPVYYNGIISEHQWTRESCSIFDVSHLGEIRVEGSGAFEFLQKRLTQDLHKCADGRMQYSLLCDEKGGVLDDILVYRASAESYYLIVNASNIEKDFHALSRYATDAVEIKDLSDHTACIAIQGPKSEAVLEKILGLPAAKLSYYSFVECRFEGESTWLSRSGYTGEDGFEIFSKPELAGAIWDKLVAARAEGVLPAGLGARNTLRLEAGNALYGNELDESISPLEAGLQWAVSFEKGAFVGRDSLLKQKEKGVTRKLVGFKMIDKAVARDGYPIYISGQKAGHVTSGSYGPTAAANIGLAVVPKGSEAMGTIFEVEVHGRRARAEVVKRPFVPLKHKR